MTTSDDSALPGATTLRLNPAGMVKALQTYLDEHVFTSAGTVRVVGVSATRDAYNATVFDVQLSGTPQTDD